MKKKISTAGSFAEKAVCLLFVAIITNCTSQNKISHIVPDDDYHIAKPDKLFEIDNIVETMDGSGNENLPDWMSGFINGGIAEVEKDDLYRDKYLFIGHNGGGNFTALSKWANNYSVVRDFPRLAAARIEKRLISAASLYPDDEYGVFFETLVKKAFDAEYPGAIKEETYWIKVKKNQNQDLEREEADSSSQAYEYFVFISIDKVTMQTLIGNMMAEVRAAVTPTRPQNASINRLQQTFFEGF